MAVNYSLIFAGILVCFGSAYYRRVLGALEGLLWGLLGYEAVSRILMMAGILGPSEGGFLYFAARAAVILLLVLVSAAFVRAGVFFYAFFAGLILMTAAGRVFYSDMSPLFLAGTAAGIGLLAGWYAYEHAAQVFPVLSAFTGSAFIVSAGFAIKNHVQAVYVLTLVLGGQIFSWRNLLIAFAAFGIAGTILQNYALKHKRMRGTNSGDSCSLFDFMWKQWGICIVMLLSLLVQPLALLFGQTPDAAVYSAAEYVSLHMGIISAVCSGIFVGGVIFFVWNYDVLTSFTCQLLYLIWIPLEMVFGTSARLAQTPDLLVLDICRYFVFWVLIAGLKQITGMKRYGPIWSFVLAVVIYPNAMTFLRTGEFLLGVPGMYDFVFWGTIAVSVLVFSLIGSPEVSANVNRRYERGSGAKYCRNCGERRKAGYKYCGNCRTEFRSL